MSSVTHIPINRLPHSYQRHDAQFAAFCADEMGGRGAILCLEPAPATHAALAANLAELRAFYAAAAPESPALEVASLQCGAGEAEGEAEFTFYERAGTAAHPRRNKPGRAEASRPVHCCAASHACAAVSLAL